MVSFTPPTDTFSSPYIDPLSSSIIRLCTLLIAAVSASAMVGSSVVLFFSLLPLTESNTVIPTAQMATMQPMMILRFAFMFIKSFGYAANVEYCCEVESRDFRIRIQMKLLNLRKYISQLSITFAKKKNYGSK